MTEPFVIMLAEGGKSNSLGRTDEVIQIVCNDPTRLEELYLCMFAEDSWLRMRAADALEKICRVHPDWLVPYVDRFVKELMNSTQPSIQWHLAQMYQQITLADDQKRPIVGWLTKLLSTTETDWIVAANAMDTLAYFAKDGSLARADAIKLLRIQQQHRSSAVVKRAGKLLDSLIVSSES